MKVKILETCQSAGFSFEKDQEVEHNGAPDKMLPILKNLLSLGFAQMVPVEVPDAKLQDQHESDHQEQ